MCSLAAAAPSGQENAAPTLSSRASNKTTAAAAAGDVTKPAAPAAAARFGFRAPAPLVTTTAANGVTVTTATQQPKRHKTNEGIVNAPQQAQEQPAAAAAAAAADAPTASPSRGQSQSANLFSPSGAASSSAASAAFQVPPVAFAAEAHGIADLWHNSMMDDTLASECKAALASKITATKFDYKERVGQMDVVLKALRKVVSTVTKKGDSFIEEATKIEQQLQEQIAREANRAREALIEKFNIQEKTNKAMQLVKQLQGQRDGLMADAQARAVQVSQHASVLDAAQALQMDTESKLAQSNKDLSDTLGLLDQTTMERDQSKKLLVEMQESADQLALQLHELEEEKSALIQTTEDQSRTIQESQAAAAEMEQQLSALREQYMTLMGQWSTLQKNYEKSEETVVALNNSVATLRGELQQAHDASAALRAELAAQQQAANEAKARAITELSSVRSALQSELSGMKHQLDMAQARNAEESAALQTNLEQLSSTKNSLMDAASKSALEVATLRTSLLHSTEKIGSLECDLRRMDGDLSLLRLQLSQKNEECFLTVQSFGNIQKFHEERQTILQAEKEALEKKNIELLSKQQALEALHKNTTANLEQTSAALAEKCKEGAEIKAEHEALLAKSKEDRESWESLQAELRSTLATLTAETTAKITALEARVAELAAKGESEKERANNLARELTSFKALSGVSSESQMENLVKLSMEAETLRTQVADKGALAASLVETRAALEAALKKMAESESSRRALHNTIQELKGNIRVFTRVRPMFHAGAKTDVNSGEAQSLSNDDQINAIEVSGDGKKLRLDTGAGSKNNFAFDAVFGPSTTQKELFDEVSGLVQSACDGFHVCLFSYGQTGSGKTWSMIGGAGEERGMIPRAAEHVLAQSQALSTGGWTYSLEASFAEIYNEALRDLLSKDSKDSDLDIKRDASGRTLIPGLTRCAIGNINDVSVLMTKAAKNRSTAATNMNERSSRSHSIFTLYLTATNPHSKQTLSGSLNLCDLAGSERLSKSGAEGDRKKETASINKSLSALSDVFLALSQKQAHVPCQSH